MQVAVAPPGDVREHAVHVRVLRAARLPAAHGRHRPPRGLLGGGQREPGAGGTILLFYVFFSLSVYVPLHSTTVQFRRNFLPRVGQYDMGTFILYLSCRYSSSGVTRGRKLR